jgi:hypothetical protein
MGLGYFGPCLHFWYCKLLPRVQAAIFPNVSKTVKVFGSMAIDQLVFAPVLMAFFFPINQIVTDRNIQSWKKGV